MNPVTQSLFDLVSRIPVSAETASSDPSVRARAVARRAALRAAGISGTLALPPGPLGLATILPDLVSIWRLQQSMVADIAAAFGKTAFLRREAMMYCLFKHGSAALMRDLVVRVGERYLIRRAAVRVIQEALEKIGIRVTQRMVEKGVSRWIPVVGAVGVGAYAYYDTTKVARTAIELFSTDLVLGAQTENPESTARADPGAVPPQTATNGPSISFNSRGTSEEFL
jgi:hypothetical protein